MSQRQDDLAAMKAQVYVDPRPLEYFDRFHERARTRRPDWVYELYRVITSLYSWTALRARCISSDKVPDHGSVILAPNHFSFLDHFLLASFLRRKVRFMAKSQMFKRPLQFMYTHGGVFPVLRGRKDERAIETAEVILENGGCLAMYCEGGRSRTGQLAERAKPGIGRIALESGAPVVPVAIYGSAKVRNWKRLQFPRVTVLYGDALEFAREHAPSRERQQEVADEIFAEIKRLYAAVEEVGHKGLARRARVERRQRPAHRPRPSAA